MVSNISYSARFNLNILYSIPNPLENVLSYLIKGKKVYSLKKMIYKTMAKVIYSLFAVALAIKAKVTAV